MTDNRDFDITISADGDAALASVPGCDLSAAIDTLAREGFTEMVDHFHDRDTGRDISIFRRVP